MLNKKEPKASSRDRPVIFVSTCGKYLKIASYRRITDLLVERSFFKVVLCINFKVQKTAISLWASLFRYYLKQTSQIVCCWLSYTLQIFQMFQLLQKVSGDEGRFHSVASLLWQVSRKLSGLITCFPSVNSSLLIGAWRKIAVISHSTGCWKFICQEKMDMERTESVS